jgi:outer membrane protein OmpA-like peptidoglycan-associated protein
MNGSRRTGLVGALIMLAGGSAAAHPEAGELDLGVFGGYHVFGSDNILGSDVGDDSGTIDDGPIFGLRLGYTLVSRLGVELEGGVFLTNPRVAFDDRVVGFAYRGNVTLRVTPSGLGGDLYLLAGAGGMTVGDSDGGELESDTKLMPHFGLAATVEIGAHLGLRFDGRAFVTKDTSDDLAFAYEGLIGLYYAWGRKPHGAPVAAKPAEIDADGDGINDDVDKCPTEPEDTDGFEDEDGCRDPDNDGDGVPDADDKCPSDPESKDGVDDADGCPEKDDDGDGVTGSRDKCPAQAGQGWLPGRRRLSRSDPDNDGDGMADGSDKCKDEPENKNGFQDDDGCPDEIPEAVKKFTGTIKGINFVTGSAKIKKGSNKTLDEAVAVLKENPSVRIEIGGHTDDKGSAEKNKALSQARAEAVKAYLVSKGIEAARLRAVGYGPEKPLDPAGTRAARAKNRRVEFVILTE